MYTYDIEQLLKNGSAVKLKPQGYSMYPLFLPGRDEAVIEHCVPSELHRGDVILYRRVQGILVLHRICRITRDGFYLVGDNQTEVEGPLSPEQIHGKLTGVVRNGKSFSVSYPIYRMLSSIWLFFTPCPPVFLVGNGFFPQVFSEALIFSLSSPNFFQNAQRNFYCIRLFAFPSPWLQCSEVSSLFQRSPDPAAAESQYTGESRRRTEAYRLLRISVVRFSASAELRPL